MGIRFIGRWIYNAVTSAPKRPYIKLTLDQLDEYTADAAERRDTLLLFGILKELHHRLTSPSRRDRSKRRIVTLLKEFEGISIKADASISEIDNARSIYLELSSARARREAEAVKARKEAEAKREEEKKEREAAETEKARLAAEAEKARLAAEKKARKEAEAQAKREAEEQARQAAEVERLRLEQERLAAEAEAQRQAEEAEKARQAAEAERQRLEQERLAAEAEAQRQAEEAEKARQAAEAERQRLEQERLAAEAEAQRQAEEADQARQAAEDERLRLEQERLAAEAEAQRQAEEAEKARQAAEAERLLLEQERLAAEAEAQRQAEEKEQARQAAEAERQRLEQERLAAEAEAQRQAEEAEKARQAAEAERLRLEQERLSAEAEAERQAEEEEQARQTAEAEWLRLEQERLAAKAEAQRREEEQKLLVFRKDLDSETSAQSQADVKAETEQLADQQDNDESPQNQQDSQVEIEDWQKWKEGDWNRCLLQYCFLSLGDSDTRIGVSSSVEDLRFAVGDPRAKPSELADAFVKSIITQAERHNVKPARLFTKRAENWNPDTPLEPPFFAFLWATCLISQGYPNPYETGQFHMRYLRVFGPEQRSTFRSLKLGWEKLSQWLVQEKALGGKEHRELTLPTELGNRTNIGYSWYLSFPSRNDRAELASVIQQLLDDGVAIVPPTAHALFAIKRSGRFGAEFARTLDKQIRAASHTGVVDDWFAGIIQHEYNQLQSAADNTPSTARRSGLPRNPDLSLQLDLEDPSRIALVLPSQVLTGLEGSNQSVTFCTLDPVGTEHHWDPKKGIVSIGEDVYQDVTEMVPTWTWKLRTGSSSGYTLKRWSCAGIEPGDLPILCFCAESGQRVTGRPIISTSSEAWFFAPKNLQPSPTESVEILDELRWGISLKGWRGYLLRLTQPKAELLWQGADESGAQQTFSLPWSFVANVTPVLRGSLIDKKERRYNSSPSLWIPPLSVPVQLILTIKDLSTNQLLSDTSDPVALQASDEWTEIDLTECIETESRFSILVQPEEDHPDLPSRWITRFQVHNLYERGRDDEILPPLLTYLHNHRPISRQLDAEFCSFFYEDVTDIWLARWLLERVWPMESVDLIVSNGINTCRDTIIADCEGMLEISAAIYRYTLQGEANSISIAMQRQGEQSSYVLATAGEEAQSTPQPTFISAIPLQDPDTSPELQKALPSRSRPVDIVVTFQPRFKARNAKQQQVADFIRVMKQLIAEAGMPAEELHPQSLDNDVWIRIVNRDHLSIIDDLLQDAENRCGFQILKQQRR
jgi:hypothetical protein